MLLVMLAATAAGLGGYAYARGRQPAAAQALATAASLLRAAPGMSYTLHSSGSFTLQLAVDWRARPLLMRVSGEVQSGGNNMGVAYWVDGDDLYVRDPGSGVWRLRRGGARLPEVMALMPANITERLEMAATGARPAGRVRTESGAAAWAYDLPGQGRLVLRHDTLAPLSWQSPLEGGGSLEVRWHALSIPPGLLLPASVQREATPAP